ncbi:hypothetical protein BC938DRAFT_473465 [Jimgerdemannia flammicorona]|uniref:Uncharacterized protein n=1 Tax=Jimgerdemannia flammicorona TaxID=994334 RepID=A0A433Q3W8_9FUNG|nr:hypothetical protein BC938DRAFT_473465 [Jimgerdemannia flammicorona]
MLLHRKYKVLLNTHPATLRPRSPQAKLPTLTPTNHKQWFSQQQLLQTPPWSGHKPPRLPLPPALTRRAFHLRPTFPTLSIRRPLIVTSGSKSARTWDEPPQRDPISNGVFCSPNRGRWFHDDKMMFTVTSSADKAVALSFATSLESFSDVDTATPSLSRAAIPSHLFFRYEDMTIHASRQHLSRLVRSLFSVLSAPALVCTNVSIPLDFNELNLSTGSRRVRDTPNAGGSSLLSEVLSLEFLERFLGVQLSKTEMEISYWPQGGPMTDYVARLPKSLGERAIGVSVTRAMAYRRPYTRQDAERLLEKKLSGVFFANKCIVNERITRQILHVWTPSGKVANVLRRAWERMSKDVLGNTVVVVSIVNSKWVFDNGRAQRGRF